MHNREKRGKYAVQYKAYLELYKNKWDIPIRYIKFADRLRHKIKRDEKRMQTRVIEVLPPIEQTKRDSCSIYAAAFAIIGFVFGVVFGALFLLYNIDTVEKSTIESYNTGTLDQEYLKTGSECEGKPSLSTNGVVVCRK